MNINYRPERTPGQFSTRKPLRLEGSMTACGRSLTWLK